VRKILLSIILLFSCFAFANDDKALTATGINASVIRSILENVFVSRGVISAKSLKELSAQQISCNLGNDSQSKQVQCVVLVDFQSKGTLVGDAESVRLVRAIPLSVHEQYLKTENSSSNILEIENVSCNKSNSKDICTYSAIIGE
jgi:hypothetical protein